MPVKKLTGGQQLARRIRRVEESSLQLLHFVEEKPEDRRNLWSWRDSVLQKAREYSAAVRSLARLTK